MIKITGKGKKSILENIEHIIERGGVSTPSPRETMSLIESNSLRMKRNDNRSIKLEIGLRVEGADYAQSTRVYLLE